LILTSGTLSPLPALASELGVEFKHQLELMHVADVAAQVYARVLSSCDGEALDSSYANAERFSYQDAVGRAVLGCAKGVPGGVLVFASSYAMLDRLRQRWEATGLWEQLEAAKPISVETRGSGEVGGSRHNRI
jgi:Rad3-related DNA helicase